MTFETYLDALALTSQTLEEIASKRLEAKRLLKMEITEADFLEKSFFQGFLENSDQKWNFFENHSIEIL